MYVRGESWEARGGRKGVLFKWSKQVLWMMKKESRKEGEGVRVEKSDLPFRRGSKKGEVDYIL